MSGENGIVRLDDSSGDERSGIDSELELGFLAVVGGEALKEEGAKTRSGSSTKGVEDQETLKRRAVVLVSSVYAHKALAFANLPRRDGSCLKYHPRSPCRSCSVHAHNYLPRPPFH